MSPNLILIEDDEDEEGFELELDWFTPKPPWYKRLWYWLTRRRVVEADTEMEPVGSQPLDTLIDADPFNKPVAVAECVEAALASTVWANRAMEMEAPGMHRYYVTGMGIRMFGDAEFQLYVRVQMQHEHTYFLLPLHEFLEQCYPIGDLTFTDYHA